MFLVSRGLGCGALGLEVEGSGLSLKGRLLRLM